MRLSVERSVKGVKEVFREVNEDRGVAILLAEKVMLVYGFETLKMYCCMIDSAV